MKAPLIHIGYHKTATTWLQEYLFDNADLGFRRFLSIGDVSEIFVQPNALRFDANATRARYEALVTDGELISVLSSERLSGHPHSGGFDSKEIADRLRSVFPDAKIVIGIREQNSAILSCYLQYVKFGGVCSLPGYLVGPKRGKDTIPGFSFDHFDYYPLVAYYIKLFGKDNVLVLPFERFKTDKRGFCRAIVNFAGATWFDDLPFDALTNRALSTFSSFPTRVINTVFVKTTLNPVALDLGELGKWVNKVFLLLDRILPKFISGVFDKSFKDYVAAKVQDRYRQSNRQLAELIDIDLAALGYKT